MSMKYELQRKISLSGKRIRYNPILDNCIRIIGYMA